jgi:uncharacterized protein
MTKLRINLSSVLVSIILLICHHNSYCQDNSAASGKNNIKIDELTEPGLDINQTLLVAIIKRDTEFVKKLLKAGADPNTTEKLPPDENGNEISSPIFICIGGNSADIEVVKALIESGVNVNIRSRWRGITPLMEACAQKSKIYLPIIELLIKAGAEVNSQDQIGQTALMYTASTHFPDTFERVKYLISAGANIDIQGNNGKTALIQAIENRQTAIAKLLISNGTDVTIKDNNEWTALRYAVYTENIEIIELLKAVGAKE